VRSRILLGGLLSVSFGPARSSPVEGRLANLAALAARLVRDARHARARLLEYLSRIPVHELYRLQHYPRLDDDCVRAVARELGEPFAEVQHTLSEFYRLDLEDYSEDYAAAYRFYLRGGQLQRDAVAFLQEMFPAPPGDIRQASGPL
jgi:hypothetical protein